MKNSTRSINFTFALMGAITGFYLIISRFPIETYFSHVEISLAAAAMFAIIIVFPIIQSLLRFIEIKPFYKAEKLFLKVHLGEKYIQQRALAYVIIVLSHFFMYLKSGIVIPQEAIFWAFLWLVLFETTLAITHFTTYVYILGDGIVIKGVDLRSDVPLSDPLISHSGVYQYDDFDTYFVKKNIITLYMPSKSGQIKMLIPHDKIQHIASFLGAKGLELIKH